MSQIYINLLPEIASRQPTSSPGRYSQPAYATQVSRDVTDLHKLVSGNSFKATYILSPHRGDIRNQHTQLRSVGMSQICINLFPEIASKRPTSSPGRYSQPAYATQVSRDVIALRKIVSENSFKATYILTWEILATSILNSGQWGCHRFA